VKFPWHLLRVTAITWGLILLLAAVTAASDIDESRRKLEEIQKRIAQTAKHLEAKQTAEHSLAEDLQTVETEISRLGTQLAGQKRRLAAMESEIADREVAAASARRAAAASEADVRRRLAALYKAGETGLVKILFSPSSPAQMAQDYDFLGRVVRRDRELLANYRQQLDELQTALARLTILRREQQAGIAALAENQKTARQALRLKEELLVQVRRDRQSLAGWPIWSKSLNRKSPGSIVKKLGFLLLAKAGSPGRSREGSGSVSAPAGIPNWGPCTTATELRSKILAKIRSGPLGPGRSFLPTGSRGTVTC